MLFSFPEGSVFLNLEGLEVIDGDDQREDDYRNDDRVDLLRLHQAKQMRSRFPCLPPRRGPSPGLAAKTGSFSKDSYARVISKNPARMSLLASAFSQSRKRSGKIKLETREIGSIPCFYARKGL